jgi:hypothetical protein
MLEMPLVIIPFKNFYSPIFSIKCQQTVPAIQNLGGYVWVWNVVSLTEEHVTTFLVYYTEFSLHNVS